MGPRKARSFVFRMGPSVARSASASTSLPPSGVAWPRDCGSAPAPPRVTALPPGGERFVDSGAAPSGDGLGQGPVAYLMHGWGGRGAQFAALVEPLATAGYRVVMLDAPSHGDSEHGPAGPGRTHGVEFARALDAAVSQIRPGRSGDRPLPGRHRDLPRAAVRLARHRASGPHRAHGPGTVAVRRIPGHARLRTAHAPRLRPIGRGLRRHPETTSMHGCRPRRSIRCRRW